MKQLAFLILFVCPYIVFSQISPVNTSQNSLKEAFSGYLEAIKSRDIESLKTYLTNAEELALIKGDGSLIQHKNNYLQAQVDWFADTVWKYQSEIVSFQEFDDTGVIIDKTKIYGLNWEFHMMVTYVFRKENKMWRLVTDICTPIEKLNNKNK